MDDPGWSRSLALGSVSAAPNFTNGDTLLLIVLLVALVLAGLSAAAETAMTSVNRIRIRNQAEEGDPRARRILRLLDKPERFLSAILVTSNVAVITASTVATILAIDLFGPGTGGLISTVVVSLIVLIFCEITPKTAAVQNPERAARLFIAPVELVSRLLGPLVKVLMFITHGIVRLFGGGTVKRGPFVTEDELRLLVEVGEQEGVLEEEEREMIHNVFELADTTVREVMVPRIDMITVEADATVDDAMQIIVEGGLSRIPVFEGTIDDIIGVLYAKDLLRVLARNLRTPSVRSLVRQAYFVPESKRLDDLLREMQQQRVHMAIVVDEYGAVSGLVTIEDLVEEIIGDIQDEYDREERLFEQVGEREYIVDAKISLDELNELLGTDLTSEDYETLGGLIYARLDKIPTTGDVVQYGDLTFTVLGTKGRRVTKVRVVREAPHTPDQGTSAGSAASEPQTRPGGAAADEDAARGGSDRAFLVASRDTGADRGQRGGFTTPPTLVPEYLEAAFEEPQALEDTASEIPPVRQQAVSRPLRVRGAPPHRTHGRGVPPRHQ
jgi:putative hemolysin